MSLPRCIAFPVHQTISSFRSTDTARDYTADEKEYDSLVTNGSFFNFVGAQSIALGKMTLFSSKQICRCSTLLSRLVLDDSRPTQPLFFARCTLLVSIWRQSWVIITTLRLYSLVMTISEGNNVHVEIDWFCCLSCDTHDGHSTTSLSQFIDFAVHKTI